MAAGVAAATVGSTVSTAAATAATTTTIITNLPVFTSTTQLDQAPVGKGTRIQVAAGRGTMRGEIRGRRAVVNGSVDKGIHS